MIILRYVKNISICKKLFKKLGAQLSKSEPLIKALEKPVKTWRIEVKIRLNKILVLRWGSFFCWTWSRRSIPDYPFYALCRIQHNIMQKLCLQELSVNWPFIKSWWATSWTVFAMIIKTIKLSILRLCSHLHLIETRCPSYLILQCSIVTYTFWSESGGSLYDFLEFLSLQRTLGLRFQVSVLAFTK